MSLIRSPSAPGSGRRPLVGVAYEGRHPELLARMLPHVGCLEITPETIAEVRGDEVVLNEDILSELRGVPSDVGIIVHGVSLSIGSYDGWSATYLRLLTALLDRGIPVRWHSEHLGYTRVGDQHLGIMLALPKTEEMLDLLCRRIEAMQLRFGLPFLVENIVHVVPDYPGVYSEAAFMNALAERTGCGLIVDVYNLECDAHNHGFDIEAFLAELRHSYVREVHVACGVKHNGFLLDVHSRIAESSTLELGRRVVERAAGSVETVVYEFMPEALPGLGGDRIVRHLEQIGQLFQE